MNVDRLPLSLGGVIGRLLCSELGCCQALDIVRELGASCRDKSWDPSGGLDALLQGWAVFPPGPSL